MALPTQTVIDWLTGLGWDVTQESGTPLVPGPYILPMPDRLITITITPGPGYVLESAADASTFQARVRGAQNDQAGAETLAFSLDALILAASFPAIVDGRILIHVHRLGGAPSPLAGGPDNAERTELVATYVAIAS
jgi:uncharacterized protein (DUF2126 family)